MASHPLLPLLVTLYQTAQAHPLGAQARQFEEALAAEAGNTGDEPLPRPTRVVTLRQAVALGVLRAEGERRGRRYFPGTENPGGWSEEGLASRLLATVGADGGVHPVPKATSGQAAKVRRGKGAATEASPDDGGTSSQAQQFKRLQSVVWGIADTLRDQSNLQVDGYRPVTLLLLTLKRGMDTQRSLQRPGQWVAKALDAEAAALDSGLRAGADVAGDINQRLETFDTKIFDRRSPDYDKSGVVMMTWEDLRRFNGTQDGRPATTARPVRLGINPPGKDWFSYATTAGNLVDLVEELVRLHAADLREAFGAIGLHAALKPQDPNAARLTDAVLKRLIDRLADVDMSMEAIPGDVFSDAYMDLLAKFAHESGKKGGDFFTPGPLVQGGLRFLPLQRIVRGLIDAPRRQVSIADPTAGAFTFLTQAYDAVQKAAVAIQGTGLKRQQFIFHAQELTPVQAGLGVFNFFFHGIASRLALIGPSEEVNGRDTRAGGAVGRIVGNSISEYVNKIGHQSGKIDLVLANPPYGTADYGIDYARSADRGRDARWQAGQPTGSEGEWAFINTVVDLMAPDGKALIVLPLGVLFRESGKAFRQFLVEKNWIEGIVALPSNQFLTTTIPVCLMLLNKETGQDATGFDGQPRRHGVFFVNASDDFTKTGKFNHWDQDAAVEAWWNRLEKPGYSGFVGVDKLREARNDYNLSLNRYFAPIKKKEALDPVALGAAAGRVRARLAARSEWFDGRDGQSGLWGQAVAASSKCLADNADTNSTQPGETS